MSSPFATHTKYKCNKNQLLIEMQHFCRKPIKAKHQQRFFSISFSKGVFLKVKQVIYNHNRELNFYHPFMNILKSITCFENYGGY